MGFRRTKLACIAVALSATLIFLLSSKLRRDSAGLGSKAYTTNDSASATQIPALSVRTSGVTHGPLTSPRKGIEQAEVYRMLAQGDIVFYGRLEDQDGNPV